MICLIAVIAIYSPMHTKHSRAFRDAVVVCEEIVERAEFAEIDPVLAVAVGSIETTLRSDLISPAGAVGPLQALPQYWCPASGECNEIDAGLSALKYYLNKHKGNEYRALMNYAGGNGAGAQKYAQKVLLRLAHLRATLDAL